MVEFSADVIGEANALSSFEKHEHTQTGRFLMQRKPVCPTKRRSNWLGLFSINPLVAGCRGLELGFGLIFTPDFLVSYVVMPMSSNARGSGTRLGWICTFPELRKLTSKAAESTLT
jgi:hypothetical protein